MSRLELRGSVRELVLAVLLVAAAIAEWKIAYALGREACPRCSSSSTD